MAYPTTVHRREREVIRLPENPALEFVAGACVLNAYGSALLVLAHDREQNPVTIHRLSYRSPVITFQPRPSPTRLERLILFPPRLAKSDYMIDLPYLEDRRD